MRGLIWKVFSVKGMFLKFYNKMEVQNNAETINSLCQIEDSVFIHVEEKS